MSQICGLNYDSEYPIGVCDCIDCKLAMEEEE